MEDGARTYAEDLLVEYKTAIGPVIKSAEFASEEWATATAAPENPVIGTESISFPAHNLQIFSPEVLDELEADMREAALEAAKEALLGQEVDCKITLHEGEPHADPPLPPSASTTFHVGALEPFMSDLEAVEQTLVDTDDYAEAPMDASAMGPPDAY